MPNYSKHETELLSGRLQKLATDSRRPRVEALSPDELLKLIAELEVASKKAGPPEPGGEVSVAALVLSALRRAKAERRRRGIRAPKPVAAASGTAAAVPTPKKEIALSGGQERKPDRRKALSRSGMPSRAVTAVGAEAEPKPGKQAGDAAGKGILDEVKKAEKEAKKAAKDARQAAKKAVRIAEREVKRAARKAVREAERDAKQQAKKADKDSKKKKDKKKKSKT